MKYLSSNQQYALELREVSKTAHTTLKFSKLLNKLHHNLKLPSHRFKVTVRINNSPDLVVNGVPGGVSTAVSGLDEMFLWQSSKEAEACFLLPWEGLG